MTLKSSTLRVLDGCAVNWYAVFTVKTTLSSKFTYSHRSNTPVTGTTQNHEINVKQGFGFMLRSSEDALPVSDTLSG